jgi:SulP family sulfate permease
MVAMERFDHFLHDMEKQGTTVLLCGVRPDFAKAMKNLNFNDWFPADRVFLEEDEKYSSTLKAIRHVHELMRNKPCSHCWQNSTVTDGVPAQYYLV